MVRGSPRRSRGRRARGPARRRCGRRAAPAGDNGLRSIDAGRLAGGLEGLRQGVHDPAWDPNGSLRDLPRGRSRPATSRVAMRGVSARRESRWFGIRQGSVDLRDARGGPGGSRSVHGPESLRSRRRTRHRGGAPARARSVLLRGHGRPPGRAAADLPGLQAPGGWRSRSEHRGHGRVFTEPLPGCRRPGSRHEPDSRAHPCRPLLRWDLLSRRSVRRSDADFLGAEGPRVQRTFR